MKKIFALLLLSVTISLSTNAENLIPLNTVIKQGLKVKMGELTGAGSKFSLKSLEGLVLDQGVLLKSDCQSILVKNSTDPKISDIVAVQFANEEIRASFFLGFVVR